MNENGIINAIRKIMQLCKRYKDCQNCPFRKYSGETWLCAFTDSMPEHWSFKYFKEADDKNLIDEWSYNQGFTDGRFLDDTDT